MMETLSIHDNHLGYIETLSGKIIDLLNPRPDQITLKDIMYGLSHTARFGGQTYSLYNVAQHSVFALYLASRLVDRELKKAILFHDASEAYIHDIIKPLKVLLGSRYKTIQTAWMTAIFTRFEIDMSMLDSSIMKAIDADLLEMEHKALRKGNQALYRHAVLNYGLPSNPGKGEYGFPVWSAEYSRAVFYREYLTLFE